MLTPTSDYSCEKMTSKIPLLITSCLWALFGKIECEFIDCFEQSDGSTCQCDRGDKMIDCRSIKSATFPVIQTKNDEYTAMSLAHTKLDPKTIPLEKNLRQKLPNLLVIYIFRNDNRKRLGYLAEHRSRMMSSLFSNRKVYIRKVQKSSCERNKRVMDLSGIKNIPCSELQRKFREIEILSSCVDDFTTIATTVEEIITTNKTQLIETTSQSAQLTTTEQSEVYTNPIKQTPSTRAKNIEKCKTTWCEAKQFYRTLKEHVMDIIQRVRTEIRKKILSQEKQRQKQALLAKNT
uniref:Uncharacterized protein n=1 Tax=Romanomermis culicivorax TaxID=13658 RepID=A0A915ITN8_ROMCU